MGGLQRFENKLEQMISGAFARAFRSAVQPVEISAALQRECDNNAQILSRQRRLVPNTFHVELSPGDLERLSPYEGTLAGELKDNLRDHADHQGYVFPGPVRIDFEAQGRASVLRLIAQIEGLDETPPTVPKPRLIARRSSGPARAGG